MPSYIKLCIMAGKEEKAVLKGDKLVMRLLDGMIALAEKVGDMTGFLFGSDLEDGIELLAELTPMIRNLSNAIKAYSEAAILFAKVLKNHIQYKSVGLHSSYAIFPDSIIVFISVSVEPLMIV